MTKGKVFLIGAGPGDVGLMTVKGLDCIKKADVIVYDRLANPRLLNYRKAEAELIYVGKSPKHHTLTQEEINQVLVEQGNAGKVVARLKGGDPYVFGRGGEEGEVLRAAGIAFEVVPGITSAIAAPAYGGIPVTHRDFTSTFTVITGHEDPTKENSNINWPRLAQDPGTLIFLMGVGNLAQIVAQLINNGKDPQTPIALIRWGTRAEQQVVTGVLDNIVAVVEKAKLKSPAVIIVGQVVSLRETLNWFENKPLFGRRILVTRSREQASVLSEQLEALGAEAWEYPTIAIKMPEDLTALDTAIQQVGGYQWLIFTSVNSVKIFFERMKANKVDIRSLGDVRVCAIGPKTREALENKGLLVEVMPAEFRAEAIVEALKERVKAGEKVLLPRADLARPILVESLKMMGLIVDEVTAYQTVISDEDSELLLEKLKEGAIHLATFTSSSTVKNFIKLLNGNLSLLDGVCIACIGPITAKTARESGLTVHIVAEEYTTVGLVKAIVQYYNKER